MNEEVIKKLISQFRDGIGAYPQYGRLERFFKLGRMKKNWSKNSVTYIKKGELVLYLDWESGKERPHSIYGPQFYYERFKMNLGNELFASDGRHVQHVSDIDHETISFPDEDIQRWAKKREEKEALIAANQTRSRK